MTDAPKTPWPELPTASWRETYATLHLMTQIVGKIRLVRSPWLNHSWHVALYVTPRGLTTSPIPADTRTFQIEFDFVDHVLRTSSSDGAQRQFALAGQSVASFYATIMAELADTAWAKPLLAEIDAAGGLKTENKARLFELRFGHAVHSAGVAPQYEVPGEGALGVRIEVPAMNCH